MTAGAYLETAIHSAGPEELVRLMYDAALQAVGRAKRHARSGETESRSREISRAHAIVAELALALNHEAAPKLARDLAELYDYIQRRLIEAHALRSEDILDEVSRLLATLLDGWMHVLDRAA